MVKGIHLDLDKVFVRVDCRLDNSRYCGRCCYETEMILFEDDIKRIESLGYPRKYFVVSRGGVRMLRNINDHCVFLDPKTNKCTIYPHRPIGCRLYPLVYDTDKGIVVVDKFCPKARYMSKHDINVYGRVLIELLRREELID